MNYFLSMQKWENIPAFKFALFFICGIIIGSQFSINKTILVLLLFLLLLFLRLFKNKNYNVFSVIIFLIIISAGIFKANIDFFSMEENSIANIDGQYFSDEIILKGIVKDYPDKDTSRIKFILDCKRVIAKDTIDAEGLVLATIKRNKYTISPHPFPDINQGDFLTLRGKLTVPLESRNPGEFNYRKYLYLNDIYNTFFVYGFENVIEIDSAYKMPFYIRILNDLRKHAIENINDKNPGEGGAFLTGLVAGERSRITKEMKSEFVNAGVMHLIAVSGLNVAYVILSVMLILSLFRIPAVYKILTTIIFIIFYCVFTGSTPSILRASIMGIMVLLYTLVERKKEFYNIIGVSLIIILAFNSKQLFDSGFILSYSAVFSMVFIYEKIDQGLIQKLYEKEFRGKKLFLIMIIIFATTLAAQIGTLPLGAFYFEKISAISLITNIIAIPLSNVSLALGFLQVISSFISDLFSSFFAETNNLLLSFQLFFIKLCSGFKFAYFRLYNFDLLTILAYYIILILILTIRDKKVIFPRIVISVLILIFLFAIKLDNKDKLRITFLDVGQGDCTLIETPDGKNILVDCGPGIDNINYAERNIIPFLERKSINKIDLLILTHLHKDHTGGFSYLAENIRIDRIIESGQDVNNSIRTEINSIIISKRIMRDLVSSGDILEISGNLKMYILFPDKEDIHFQNISGDEKNLNSTSLVFKLKYMNNEIFFSGDIEAEQEEKLVKIYGDFLRSDLLKIPHHGSKTSSSNSFLIETSPRYSVISCGMFNMHKNPSSLIINRLKNLNSIVFRTDTDGAVIFDSDGENIEPVKWK